MSLFLCQPIPLNLFHVSESSDHFPVVTLLYLFGHSVTPSLGFSLFTWLLGYHAFRFPSILLAGTLIHLCWFLFIFLSYPGVPQDKPSNLFFPHTSCTLTPPKFMFVLSFWSFWTSPFNSRLVYLVPGSCCSTQTLIITLDPFPDHF